METGSGNAAGNRRVMPMKSLVGAVVVLVFAGCANAASETLTSSNSKVAELAEVNVDFVDGRLVDYGGHRCGHPNMYVKSPPCFFPKR